MQSSAPAEQAAVLALALAIDLAWGEPPPAWHPVVWVGRLISRLEAHAPRTGPVAQLVYGVWLTGLTVAACWLAGMLVEQALSRLPAWLRVPLAAQALKTLLSARMLDEAAAAVEHALACGDVAEARARLVALVSRDRSELTPAQCASAAIESLAENLADSCAAPALAYALFGLPGAAAYRAANTLDAMIGYRGRYEYLGKAAARLDDLLNLIPARLSAAALVAGAALAGAGWRGAVRAAWHDAGRTASPNAGWPMAAMAGALGVRLEKPGHYCLGDPSREPDAHDIARARVI
ncbi:MAG: adenosylcobinamide-phosphate synthase CbiB, partial [Dehalococcoidia bacterium]|nr:adenosylcobinamide-phosphate synthase CbiB [Dehalococcoidia bacterium]